MAKQSASAGYANGSQHLPAQHVSAAVTVFLGESATAGSAKPDPEVEELLAIASGSRVLKPLDLLKDSVATPGFRTLLGQPDMLQRILDEFPLLSALEGFQAARAATLPEKMAEAFERGMSSLLSSSTAPQDPVQMAKAASDLFSSPVPNVQALITGARAGDMQAARSLREKMGERLAPGVDMQAFKEAAGKYNAKLILDVPEVMHYVDQDPVMSALVRGTGSASKVHGEHYAKLLEWLGGEGEEDK